ncbi:MAG TPA: hypothetical protein HPP77_06130 [Candidatus Hydrogenedentes bacterium]|nr:hypothetical protein [Candidatus Hydrogenedentota bacterium]HIJ72810.1 hypothetical protein [Candidatus Hydrogenedentota bacterium]
MDNRFEPGIDGRVRKFCRQISVAHGLDPEIQEELVGHFEDKMLAYLDGEETLTQADALILARQHFGDPAVLKRLLQQTHRVEAAVGLARRLAAVTIASLATMALSFALMLAAFIGCLFWQRQLPFTGGVAAVSTVLSGLGFAAGPALLWLILGRWERILSRGCRLWFLRWSPWTFAGLIALLVTLVKTIPFAAPHLLSGRFTVTTFIGLSWGSVIAHCMAWLWWCDRPPRRRTAISVAFLAWLALWVVLAGIPPLEFVVSESARAVSATRVVVTEGSFFENFSWQLGYEAPTVQRLWLVPYTGAFMIGLGYVARLIHLAARRFVGGYSRRLA